MSPRFGTALKSLAALPLVLIVLTMGAQQAGAAELRNRSGQLMSVAELANGSQSCEVWNYSGGNRVNWQFVDFCRYRAAVTPSDSSSYVDAFTTRYYQYAVRWWRDGTPGGWRLLGPGDWTKIRDFETADCTIGGGRVYCTIYP